MLQITREQVAQALDWPSLVEALRAAFKAGCEAPVRHHHDVATSGSGGTLLLMPAWQVDRYLGVKIATVFPDNAQQSRPAVAASYLLSSARTGEPVALIEGTELTARRTAAASALAASYLSRSDSKHLVMVGTGRLAPNLIAAHAAVRPLERVTLWGRSAAKAEALAGTLRETLKLEIRAAADLAAAVAEADIVSCATLSKEPLVRGAWLRPGTHLDLVGGFTPQMREADDAAIRKADVFVDTRAGALKEAGDIVQPLAAGVLRESEIRADLFELARGQARGRETAQAVTLFKSVGAAIEDLAAAILVYERCAGQGAGGDR